MPDTKGLNALFPVRTGIYAKQVFLSSYSEILYYVSLVIRYDIMLYDIPEIYLHSTYPPGGMGDVVEPFPESIRMREMENFQRQWEAKK